MNYEIMKYPVTNAQFCTFLIELLDQGLIEGPHYNHFVPFDYESENMGQCNRHTEMEIYLTTFDGAQHLRFHGWLKRNDTLIKTEQFASKGDGHFGGFIVYITTKTLDKLKEENTEKGLFANLEILSGEKERWNTYKEMDGVMKLDEGIKNTVNYYKKILRV